MKNEERVKLGNTLLFVILFATLALSVTVGCASGATPPEEEWNQTFGGTGGDWAESVQQTTDGGYILAGWTRSYGASWENFWLVKTDSNGNEQWNRTFGGADSDEAYSVQQTSDSGYILAGSTWSYGAGYCDFWLVKTDANGNKEWDKTFGGTDYDWAHAVQQTADGCYILVGYTMSYSAGSTDFWLVKVKGEETPEPAISIYTDKTSYTSSDTMNLGLDVNNPVDSAQRVSLHIYLEQPTGGTFTLLDTTVTLSAGLDYRNPSFMVFTLPPIASGPYKWHAKLSDPVTGEMISERIAPWEFVATGTSIETEDISEVLKRTTVVIDFDEKR